MPRVIWCIVMTSEDLHSSVEFVTYQDPMPLHKIVMYRVIFGAETANDIHYINQYVSLSITMLHSMYCDRA